MGCLGQAVLHVLCYLAVEKDKTKSKSVISRARELQTRNLEVRKSESKPTDHPEKGQEQSESERTATVGL